VAINGEQAGRELVAKSCRVIGGLELTKAATGHVSQRSEDGQHVLIRARGADEVGVRYTTADEVIKVDMNGKKVDGPDGLAVPQEVFIHTWLYKTRPEVKSVIHIHPPTVVLFTICEKDLMPLYGAYDPSSLHLWIEGIPTYGRSITISNDALASVEEATVTAIKLNELAEMNYRAHLLGDPKPIPDQDLEEYRARHAKRGGFSGSPHGQSSWRYYERLSGA
jgi:ribulose-5-phosphate 4-epimerase/fuculose-1-phosphate aldolase